MQLHTCGEWTSQSNTKYSYAALYRGLNDLKQTTFQKHTDFAVSYMHSDDHSGAEEQWRASGQESNQILPRGW